MSFELHLEVPEALVADPGETAPYDPELDDVRSILRDVSESLSRVPQVQLGLVLDQAIPLSVRRDLAVVMEQLGEVLRRLRDGSRAELELYEQGVETRISFTPKANDRIAVERHDLLERSPPMAVGELPRTELMRSLSALGKAFVEAARRRNPRRANHPWFLEWSRALADAAPR